MKMRRLICVMSLLFYQVLLGQDLSRYDLIFHEVYADPSPSRGLPNAEFIELRNRSGKEINLKNWAVSNGTTTGRVSGNLILKPDSLVILVSSGSVASYGAYGNVIALSPFPALDNDGDTLVLLSPAGTVVHAIAWDKSWYGNDVKEDGGWSIELRDPTRPCADKENWSASTSVTGGSPGRKNSIASVIVDSTYPRLLYTYMQDSLTLFAVFSKPVESILSLQDIQIDKRPAAVSAAMLPPLFRVMRIALSAPLKKETIYTLQTGIVSDCVNNRSPQQSATCGVFSPPVPGDIIVNEILFDPPPLGSDYLELYNASPKIVDLRTLSVANRNSLGKVSSVVEIAGQSRPFFPGEYLVMTPDTAWLMKTYQPGRIRISSTNLPSYPDAGGDVVLLDNLGNVMEEFRYSDKWHYQLISNPEGVALERIMQNAPAQRSENWHSASTTSGYGTPGKANSQQQRTMNKAGPWLFSTRLISPDGDGRDDLLIISYAFQQPGYMANLSVFSTSGQPVKKIAVNALCGTTGFFRWDGTGEKGDRLLRGHYIVYAEVFRLDGTVTRSRELVGIW